MSHVNAQLAVGARIAILRRSAPRESPHVRTLIAAELPILTIEAALAAFASFTLVGPLGLPWWLPLACFAAVISVAVALRSLAGKRRHGFWQVGAAAAVLVFGPQGVATVAAAGVLLTATGTVGSLTFAGWALGDGLRGSAAQRALAFRWERFRQRAPLARARAALATLAGLEQRHARLVEVAYFGGLSRAQIGRTLCLDQSGRSR